MDFGSSANLPEDRDALKNIATSADGVTIGEGSYVVFVGFMLDAHSTSKESVSCQKGTVGFSTFTFHWHELRMQVCATALAQRLFHTSGPAPGPGFTTRSITKKSNGIR